MAKQHKPEEVVAKLRQVEVVLGQGKVVAEAEASGDGDVQLEDDGTLTGDIRCHLGDRSSFIAKRW